MEKEQEINLVMNEREIISTVQRDIQSSAGEVLSCRHPQFRMYKY